MGVALELPVNRPISPARATLATDWICSSIAIRLIAYRSRMFVYNFRAVSQNLQKFLSIKNSLPRSHGHGSKGVANRVRDRSRFRHKTIDTQQKNQS